VTAWQAELAGIQRLLKLEPLCVPLKPWKCGNRRGCQGAASAGTYPPASPPNAGTIAAWDTGFAPPHSTETAKGNETEGELGRPRCADPMWAHLEARCQTEDGIPAL